MRSIFGWISRSRHAPGRHGIRNETEVEKTLNECQSRICAVRGQPLGFPAPEGGFFDPDNPPKDGNFFVDADCRELARHVTAFEREVREMKDRAG